MSTASAPETLAPTEELPAVLAKPRERDRGGKVETALIGSLLVLLGALSVARLTTRGVESGAFADADILRLSWVTPLLLAVGWAVAIDLVIYTAIWVIRRDSSNPAAWALLMLFAFFNVWSQAHGPEPWMIMATAPVAVVLIIAARHLVPAIREAIERQRLAERLREKMARGRPTVLPAPHRETSPSLTIHNTIHTTAASRADAATLTTPPHHGETGEEVTGEVEEKPPAVTPHRREVIPATITTPPRHREITAPPVPPFSSVEEAWEEIVVRQGGRLGWRRAMKLTGVNEYTARTETARLRTGGEVRTS